MALCAILSTTGAWGGGAPDGARALFDRYQILERRFDPGLADLYHDDAVIWVTRIYADGVVRQLKIPGEIYTRALRESMAEAAERGDFNQYSDIAFSASDDTVEITARRYNLWHHYFSPYRAQLRRDEAGAWRIVEEWFETQVPQAAGE